MTPDRRGERKSGEAGLSHQRLSEWLHLIMPNRYIGAIYAIFLFFLALYAFRVMNDNSKENMNASKALNFVSYEQYTGVTEGDIVRFDEVSSHSGPSKHIYKGDRYKIFVVFRAYHKEKPRFFKEYYYIGKYVQSYRFVPVEAKKIEGPAIICIGRNRYAYMDMPSVEHVGFLNLSRIEKNKINIKGSWAPDLDTSLYSTDCQPPDKAVIGQLESLFNIRLPVAD